MPKVDRRATLQLLFRQIEEDVRDHADLITALINGAVEQQADAPVVQCQGNAGVRAVPSFV
jgi:hypothetical protein